MSLRITYNAPVVLTFALLSGVILLINMVTGNGIAGLVSVGGHFNFSNPTHYLGLLTHTLGHADPAHLLGNMAFFLLLGPLLEEKYGSKRLLLFIASTALITSVLQLLFFSEGLWGASGIVFMFIMLASMTNLKSGEIPLSFLLVAVLFIGKEIYSSFQADTISQFAHILGGICGSVIGYLGGKKPVKIPLVEE